MASLINIILFTVLTIVAVSSAIPNAVPVQLKEKKLETRENALPIHIKQALYGARGLKQRQFIPYSGEYEIDDSDDDGYGSGYGSGCNCDCCQRGHRHRSDLQYNRNSHRSGRKNHHEGHHQHHEGLHHNHKEHLQLRRNHHEEHHQLQNRHQYHQEQKRVALGPEY